MGINQLQLSAELIAALYPESLVRIENSDPVKNPAGTKKLDLPENRDYSFLGKNLRSICFLVLILMKNLYPADNWFF